MEEADGGDVSKDAANHVLPLPAPSSDSSSSDAYELESDFEMDPATV